MRVGLRTVTMDAAARCDYTRQRLHQGQCCSLLQGHRTQSSNHGSAKLSLCQFSTRSGHAQEHLWTGPAGRALAEREKINTRIQEILDAQTEPWGIKVVLVEVKDIDLPLDMQRAMAKQAEAERERRAKVIHAEGEFPSLAEVGGCAEIIAKHPAAMHLRFLQSLVEVSAENNSTVVVPVPVDLLRAFFLRRAALLPCDERRSDPE